MAHHCGFTPGALQRCFEQLAFGEVLLRRRVESLELVALARVRPPKDADEREALFSALAL
jgi:hypothetical protein